MRPSLLLLDEPVAGLNETPESDELGEWLITAKRQLSLTIVMIEHDMAVISKLADMVLVLDFGEVICCEPPAEAMRDLAGDRGVHRLPRRPPRRPPTGQPEPTESTAAQGLV